jgi:hypothetical protein
MANQIYRLQNHSIIKAVKKKPKPYNVVNRNSMSVTGVNAINTLDAMKKGRVYFNCNNVRIIK